MKRIALFLIALLYVGTAWGDACGNKLTGAGINPGQATAICAAAVSAVGQDFLPKTDGTYDLGSTTKEWEDAHIDGTAHIDTLDIDVAGTSDGNFTFTQSGATVNGTSNLAIGNATSDGSDSGYLFLAAATADPTRGANLLLYGNENASTGSVVLQGGLAAGGDILLVTSAATNDIKFQDEGGVLLTVDAGTNELIAATGVGINGGAGKVEVGNGTDLPATCAIGEIFIDTDDDACADAGGGGGATCACQATNTWVEIS